MADILREHLESAPRMIRFSKDGNYAYVLCEESNAIDVYRYACTQDGPQFEEVQSIPTVDAQEKANCGASDIEITEDGNYLFCSNAGVNTVVIYQIDKKTGMLEEICDSKISGNYPKSIAVFPDDKHFVSLNHDTNQITIFAMNYEKKYFLMEGKPISIDQPNCIYIHKLG